MQCHTAGLLRYAKLSVLCTVAYQQHISGIIPASFTTVEDKVCCSSASFGNENKVLFQRIFCVDNMMNNDVSVATEELVEGQ
jgi:hypothetical protein